MAQHITILVTADPDQDDCLAAAADALVADLPDLAGYDLSPEWGDDDRETVRLTLPAWAHDAAVAAGYEVAS